MEKYKENRARCIACKYYGRNECPKMAGADIGLIDKCILEHSFIKNIKEGSIEHFLFMNEPTTLLSYFSFSRKDTLPKVGATVLTLTQGFNSSYSGRILTVTSYDSVQIFLKDDFDKEFCVENTSWYKKLFVLEE